MSSKQPGGGHPNGTYGVGVERKTVRDVAGLHVVAAGMRRDGGGA
jgi:hypothetical protein